ncbi:MAG: hypothetical protein Q7T59_05070 [Candidatus Woesebacteria bacterium]|nr:hypothetical protein [Candidatus Woesebacteria bacterium]
MEISEINKWVEGEYDKWSATGLSPLFVVNQILHPVSINELGKLDSETMRRVVNAIHNKNPEGLKDWIEDTKDTFDFEDKQTKKLAAIARNTFYKNK